MNISKKYLFKVLLVILFNLCVIAMVSLGIRYKTTKESGQSVQTFSRVGSKSGEVLEIQRKLNSLGYDAGGEDGVFGAVTEKALRNFQADNGLAIDGIAGDDTLNALNLETDFVIVTPESQKPLSGVYKEGYSGDITEIQKALAAAGYYKGAVDGVFAKGTSSAVKNFQRDQNLVIDGIVGTATLRALGLGVNPFDSGYSDADFQLLARLVSAEARGEPYLGQVAVAAVILNRLEHPSFPDTLAGVAYAPGAFSAMTNGQIKEPVAQSAYRAAKDALNGADPSGGSIYYYNPKTNNRFIKTRPIITVIGLHVFCS